MINAASRSPAPCPSSPSERRRSSPPGADGVLTVERRELGVELRVPLLELLRLLEEHLRHHREELRRARGAVGIDVARATRVEAPGELLELLAEHACP